MSYLFRETPDASGHVVPPLSKPKAWYAIRTRSKFEGLVSASLRGKGYEEFLPLYRSRRSWSDRSKELDSPLFPGYLFCRFHPEDRLLPILTTPGVVLIVGVGRVPVPASDEEIESVRALLRSGVAARPHPFLNAGDRVYLENGPFAGVEGFVVTADKQYRIVVSITLLQRSVSVEVDRAWIRPLAKPVRPDQRLRVV